MAGLHYRRGNGTGNGNGNSIMINTSFQVVDMFRISGGAATRATIHPCLSPPLKSTLSMLIAAEYLDGRGGSGDEH